MVDTMKNEQHNFNEDELIQSLGKLPLQDVPADLTDRIMAQISVERPGILRLIIDRISAPLTISFRPIFAFGVVALFCGAFLLGRMSINSPLVLPPIVQSPLQERLAEAVNNARAAYLIGRDLLAVDDGIQALPLLQKAALLEPENPEYAYWEGVGYWANGDQVQERNSYLRGLAATPESVPLLVNLGHSYLGEKKYDQALQTYKAVLVESPGEAIALYNRGLIYRKTGKVQDEISAWKLYLEGNRTGKLAFRAVKRLNDYGDFSYRPYRVGARNVIFFPEALLDYSLPEQRQMDELTTLVEIIEKNDELKLQVVVFIENDLGMARSKALDIKRLIVGAAKSDVEDRVALSWFDKPEIIKMQDSEDIELSEGILLFNYLAPGSDMEVSI